MTDEFTLPILVHIPTLLLPLVLTLSLLETLIMLTYDPDIVDHYSTHDSVALLMAAKCDANDPGVMVTF